MSDKENVNVFAIALWEFVKMLDTHIRSCWIHLINEKRNLVSFIHELKGDPTKFYNYCRVSITSFTVLLGLVEDKITKQNTHFLKDLQKYMQMP